MRAFVSQLLFGKRRIESWRWLFFRLVIIGWGVFGMAFFLILAATVYPNWVRNDIDLLVVRSALVVFAGIYAVIFPMAAFGFIKMRRVDDSLSST